MNDFKKILVNLGLILLLILSNIIWSAVYFNKRSEYNENYNKFTNRIQSLARRVEGAEYGVRNFRNEVNNLRKSEQRTEERYRELEDYYNRTEKGNSEQAKNFRELRESNQRSRNTTSRITERSDSIESGLDELLKLYQSGNEEGTE